MVAWSPSTDSGRRTFTRLAETTVEDKDSPAVGSRVDRTRAAIIEASIALMDERGYAGFSIVQLVNRTGIARTTIYRHWPSRAELLSEVIGLVAGPGAMPDTGSLRGDLLAFFATRVHAVREGDDKLRGVQSLPAVVEAARRDPSVAGVVTEIAVSLLAQIRVMLQRGVERGEVRPDSDLEITASLLLGAVHVRRNFLNEGVQMAFVETMLDIILNGVAPAEKAVAVKPAAKKHAAAPR